MLAVVLLCGPFVPVSPTANAQEVTCSSLREMDMHIHCGLERRLPLDRKSVV